MKRINFDEFSMACRRGNIPEIKELLDKCDDINEEDEHGKLPVCLGLRKADVINLLLDYKADINAQDPGGNTALIWAIRQGKKDNAILLIERGADIKLKNFRGNSPLMFSVNTHYYRQEIFDKLIKQGVRLDEANNEGETALFDAARGNPKAVELLLENGANPNIKNNKGSTVLDMAVESSNTIAILALKPEFLNGYRDDLGNNLAGIASIKASKSRDADDVITLYENGADFFEPNNEGCTPYDTLMEITYICEKLKSIRNKLTLMQLIESDNEDYLARGL